MICKLLKYPVVMPLLLIVFAVVLRVILEIQGWMPTNGDESIMNLAALHIAYRGFLLRTALSGSLEAYIGALLFRLFAPSVLVMRSEMIGFYAAFSAVLYAFVKRVYSRNFALVVLAILALGSPRVFELQVVAIGYPELPMLCALLFLAFVATSRLCASKG